MRNYKCLSTLKFVCDNFHLEPIRDIDKYEILEIRNQQLYHLRQSKPLTKVAQEHYFANTINLLFDLEQPNQVLFSFFENNNFIGYGGLVHINWIDKNAEISFVMKTQFEQNYFSKYWSNYLKLIEKVAFDDLNFHKIYTYAFDLRPRLYQVLEEANFREEARLKEHCYFDDTFIDVVYHSKINRTISFRKANLSDVMLFFEWTNEPQVRQNSYQTEPVLLENHENWFKNKINDDNCTLLVFENHLKQAIGQVRIEKKDQNSALIGISNDKNHRQKGYATKMIELASAQFLDENPAFCICAYIKLENEASKKAFEKAGYQLEVVTFYEEIPSYYYIFKL